MKLHWSPRSPFVRKVLAFAAEKGVAVDSVALGGGSQDPGFLAASPFRKVPALRDGDFTLSDSSAIVAYLDASKPQAGLIPAAPQVRAKVVWFDEFADTILGDAVLKMFFNRIVGPKFMGLPGDAAVADQAEKELLPPLLDWLDGALADREFLVGGALTLADISVASLLVNLMHLGIVPDRTRHPHVADFAGRMLARPSFAALIEKETAFLARFA